jgi:hypothetical protein
VVHDPWNYWVFNSSVSGSFNGQQSVHSGFASVSFSANRITDQWKINTGVNYNYNETDFRVPDQVDSVTGATLTTKIDRSFSRGYNLNASIVKTAGAHWGVGARMSVSSSTFNNEELFARFAPAVEFDIFPYSQSTRQLVTLHYEVGAARHDYLHLTLYGKYHEFLFDQTLTLSAAAKEPWGTVNGSLEAAAFLHDLSKHHITLNTGTSLNLYRGLSLQVFGSVGLIHDQLDLPAGGVSADQILLQQQALASTFSYNLFFGFSFNFGSIFNNVVNQRFGGSSGGMMIMM